MFKEVVSVFVGSILFNGQQSIDERMCKLTKRQNYKIFLVKVNTQNEPNDCLMKSPSLRINLSSRYLPKFYQ